MSTRTCFDNLADEGSSLVCNLSEQDNTPTERIKVPRDDYGNLHTLLLTQSLFPNPHQIIIGQGILLKAVDHLV